MRALLVLAFAALGAAARFGFVAALPQFGEAVVVLRALGVGHRPFTE